MRKIFTLLGVSALFFAAGAYGAENAQNAEKRISFPLSGEKF